MDGSHSTDDDNVDVRRRHPAPQEDLAGPPNPGPRREGSQTPPDPPDSDVMGPDGPRAGPIPTPETTMLSQGTVPAAGTVSRVRFSEDIQRGSSMDVTASAGMTEPSQHPRLRADADANAYRRSLPPILTTATEKSDLSPDVRRQGSGGLNAGATSPHSPRLSGPKPSPQMLPITPTRARGYSLRRSLFTRSVQDQVENVDVLELQRLRGDRASMSGPSHSNPGPTTTKETKSHRADGQPSASDSSNVKSKKAHGVTVLPHYEAWFQQRAARAPLLARWKMVYAKARKAILRMQELQPTKNGRHIDLNAMRTEPLIDERTGRPYVGNTIRSSRYTLWTFLPRQLFAQFSKLANLFVGCLHCRRGHG